MTDNYIKEYQDRCDHEWIHTLDDMGCSVDICNECGAWKHYDKKTKEQIDKDFEEILAMSKTGKITISTREFSELVNAVERVREWANQLQEIKPQNGFMDMNGAGNYLLYLIGDIEKPNEVTPELKIEAARKLYKMLESEQ